jgi:hypothetical protein
MCEAGIRHRVFAFSAKVLNSLVSRHRFIVSTLSHESKIMNFKGLRSFKSDKLKNRERKITDNKF